MAGQYLKETIACHHISMKGDLAQELPGKWTVDVFVDGNRVDMD